MCGISKVCFPLVSVLKAKCSGVLSEYDGPVGIERVLQNGWKVAEVLSECSANGGVVEIGMAKIFLELGTGERDC